MTGKLLHINTVKRHMILPFNQYKVPFVIIAMIPIYMMYMKPVPKPFTQPCLIALWVSSQPRKVM